jgi:hypothetical protein
LYFVHTVTKVVGVFVRFRAASTSCYLCTGLPALAGAESLSPDPLGLCVRR